MRADGAAQKTGDEDGAEHAGPRDRVQHGADQHEGAELRRERGGEAGGGHRLGELLGREQVDGGIGQQHQHDQRAEDAARPHGGRRGARPGGREGGRQGGSHGSRRRGQRSFEAANVRKMLTAGR